MNYWVRHYKYILSKFFKTLWSKILNGLSKCLAWIKATCKTIKTFLIYHWSLAAKFIKGYIILILLVSSIILPFTLANHLCILNTIEEEDEEEILEFHTFIPKANIIISTSTLEAISDSVFSLILNMPEYDIPVSPTKFVENYMDYTFVGYNIEEKLKNHPNETINEAARIRNLVQQIWRENNIEADISISLVPPENPELVVLCIDQYGVTTYLDHQVKDFDEAKN